MQYILVTVVVAGLCLIYGRIWLRRRRETPLRREMRARDVTFRVVLDHVSVREPGWLQPDHDFDVPISSPVELIVRGDAFEISSARSLGRVVMGLEYFFRARETSVGRNRPVPRIYGWDTPPRIVVRGWQARRYRANPDAAGAARYTGQLSFYRCRTPGPVPLSRLIAIASARWRVVDHQLARQSASLDAGQVIRWKSWHRWTAICLLACTFLAVAVRRQHDATP
jgi:hypothetical protein